jgi:hypothetical protein
MSNAVATDFQPITGTEVGPAVWHPGWLPDVSPFPELCEARADYDRLRAAWQTASQRRTELEAQLGAAGDQRAAKLRDAYLRGDENPEAGEADQTLSTELADVKVHAQAALDALIAHINNSILLVVDHRQEWLDAITRMEGSVVDEIAATEARLVALRAQTGTHGRLSHWVERTANAASFPIEHFAYAEIGVTTGDEAQDEQREMHKSYAGDQKLIGDGQADALQGRNEARQQEVPTEGSVELSALDEDDLVDWLMGTGMFDGDPRPQEAEVLAAAQGDPEMASRLVSAEGRANPEVTRPGLLDALTKITERKAGA